MSRSSPQTPLVLWICAAVCAHFFMGGGTEEVSKQLRKYSDDRQYISMLASKTRERVRASEQSFDIAVVDEGKPKEDEPEEPPQPPPVVAEKKPDPAKPEPPKTAEQKKVEPPKPEVKIVVKDEDPLKKLDEQPLKNDKRIAVKQHPKTKQDDNPNARFIADEANKTEEESVATQTAHDQDDPNPTPGTAKPAGPKDRTGDSERTKIADSDTTPGAKDRAPGDKGTEFDVQVPPKPNGKTAAIDPKASPNPGGDGKPESAAQAAQKPTQDAPGGASQATPEVAQGAQGWTFDPTRPGGSGAGNQGGAGSSGAPRTPGAKGSPGLALGLGAKVAPGQVNLNLNQTTVVATIGADQLRRERVADGERRKSEHRGAFQASNFERWRSAIENYVTTVKPGNQTALNAARVPFATYLNTIHNRIHPIFADSFLGSLDGLPGGHPLSNPRLVTHLEIVVAPKDGQIVKMGVVKASGVTAFDVAALDSVKRASPFGPAPSAIVSTDGNVYLHWEFHRDEVFACSTMNARPFMLNLPAPPPATEPPPARPPTEERAPAGVPNETRHGAP